MYVRPTTVLQTGYGLGLYLWALLYMLQLLTLLPPLKFEISYQVKMYCYHHHFQWAKVAQDGFFSINTVFRGKGQLSQRVTLCLEIVQREKRGRSQIYFCGTQLWTRPGNWVITHFNLIFLSSIKKRCWVLHFDVKMICVCTALWNISCLVFFFHAVTNIILPTTAN